MRHRHVRAPRPGSARGQMGVGDELANASLTGAVFRGRIDGLTHLGPHEAVVTTIAGRGFVTGTSTFMVDARDPLGDGFLLR